MKLQAPRGTRDFFPADMAWHNYLLDTWRSVSIRHGFEQVDGPIFESLDLYKVKSGEGIVSELFHFEDRGGRGLAIRPEFTPTLARMVASQVNSLPKPIKWFATPNFCRAERPQRGRLREFWQWNVDMLGSDNALADAECLLVAVDLMQTLGLTRDQVKIKLSHRDVVKAILLRLGVPEDKMQAAFELLDGRDKMEPDKFKASALALGLDEPRVERFEQMCRRKYPAGDVPHLQRSIGFEGEMPDLQALDDAIVSFGLQDWCEYDLGIVRGLAYYTGTVFEVHETSGMERALAGGGRYDKLIELFDGPPTPAVGFGMGDVVLTNVLRDKGLIPDDVAPRPDAFVIAASDEAVTRSPALTAALRLAGLHVRLSYRETRNVGKLLKEASSAGARFAVIVENDDDSTPVQVKNLGSGEQQSISQAALVDLLRPTDG